jgi:hypothetical protein
LAEVSVITAVVERAFDALWMLQPGWAVYLGKHEYDGLVPDWTPDAVASTLRRLTALGAELDRLDATGQEAIDRELLAAQIDKARFEWQVLRVANRNPMPWVYALDPDVYLRRRYADPEVRAGAAARLLGGADELLATARRQLDVDLDRTICSWGITAANGLAATIRHEVVPAFGLVEGSSEQRALDDAVVRAGDALDSFARWLETERLPGAGDAFAIGADQMEELLRVSEMITMPLDEMLAVAERDLAANRRAFIATAAAIDPEASPRAVYESHVASSHAERGGLLEQAEAMLETIRGFVVDHDLITVPSEVRARVAATPKHLRWAFAMMDTPGPYEAVATDAYYFVTPAEPEWGDAEAESWLRTLNTFALEDISIHEAYPGHYVHFLHYAAAPTEVARRLTSYAFTEGWAHYTEQMMWEAGYRDGDPRFRLAQLSEALVRNCRFVCAIGLHARGMTVDEATQFFVENAFYHELAARKEAERGTFDPGYYSYTLGKLQILRLREDCRVAWGDGFTLKRFHDALLSRGAPPVETMRKVLLG